MRKKAYRYRFYPTSEQAQNLARTFGCCRFIYNWALKLRTTSYFQHGIRLYHQDLSAALTALKKEEGTAWLKEVSSVPLQQALRHLDMAFTNFFEKRKDYSTYKKKHGRQSATFAASAFTWDGKSLTLAKQQEHLSIVWSRPLPVGCKPSSVTISLDKGGRYFISILVEEEISKGSKNRDKARQKVARLHARIADSRHDFQHKATTKLIRENQVICIETLAIKNMLKNHKLAKAIADVGWLELVRQLEYKAAWYGRTVVKIDRWYPSSKTCSACQHVLEVLPLDIRSWACPNCGTCHDRDINAAKNIWRLD